MLSQPGYSKYDRRYSQELQSECMQWIEGSVLFFVANVSLNQTTPTLGTCSPELFRTVRLPSNVGLGPRPLAMHRNEVLHETSPSNLAVFSCTPTPWQKSPAKVKKNLPNTTKPAFFEVQKTSSVLVSFVVLETSSTTDFYAGMYRQVPRAAKTWWSGQEWAIGTSLWYRFRTCAEPPWPGKIKTIFVLYIHMNILQYFYL